MGREQAEKLWESFANLGFRRIVALVLLGLSIMAVVGGASYLMSGPQQQMLYSGLSRDDVGRIGSALKGVGIDFDVSPEGDTVTVDYGDAARARMLLAEKGLPQSTDSGYELFNQIGTFGLTSFMQGVTKTRALEGELTRSIQSMNGIRSARVHLVLPDRGSFRSDQESGSASVVISTILPTDATPAQAIRHLVAAAVPGLKIDNVTVLNTEGAVLASGGDMESASAGKMTLVTQTVARDIEQKVRRTLTPYLGVGNFQVSIVPRLNMDRKTISETIFDPSSRVERSVRTVRENALMLNSSSETATTIQNNIPEQNTGSEGGSNSNETNERREELTNYEVSTTRIETATEGFEIEQLSIAVLVNKLRLTAAEGSAEDPVPVEHQMMEIEQLVASASGFSKDRGDQLKVAAVAFVDSTPEVLPEPGLLATVMDQFGAVINALALIVVTVLAIMLGLRPALNAILTKEVPAPAGRPSLPDETRPATAGDLASGGTVAGDPDVSLIEDVAEKLNKSPHKRLEKIVELDETQAAAILRQWLRQDEAA